ncbi:unnamed protein product [Linum tenue]|uniref:X8 domain-containing protein n=1 Tax=Linum tenue TaxID=586396 RepID=A0AAV0GWB6_9ROSI|nr:unnamed protein product [Linum tenue]
MKAFHIAFFTSIVALQSLNLANAQNRQRWCIPKPGVTDSMLIENIKFACDQPNMDCTPIQPGGGCPQDLTSRAAYAMNLYYQDHGEVWDCDFSNTATLTDVDPSTATCKFISKLTPARLSWCVPKPGTPVEQLKSNIDYVCSQPKMDCGPIQLGGECYDPNTAASHAAFAMNLYYQSHGNKWDCDFSNSAVITNQDPSVMGAASTLLGP